MSQVMTQTVLPIQEEGDTCFRWTNKRIVESGDPMRQGTSVPVNVDDDKSDKWSAHTCLRLWFYEEGEKLYVIWWCAVKLWGAIVQKCVCRIVYYETSRITRVFEPKGVWRTVNREVGGRGSSDKNYAQQTDEGGWGRSLQIFSNYITSNKPDKKRKIVQSVVIGHEQPPSGSPVSYTHLDVYKRQILRPP